MRKFRCRKCRKTFETEGKRRDWMDATYGPCFQYTAACPSCGGECAEVMPAVLSRKGEDSDDFGGGSDDPGSGGSDFGGDGDSGSGGGDFDD
jgi:uncharacterized membrane protein YgcG